MKNYTRVLTLVVLSAVLAGFAGCSSSQLAATETTDVPVEANAGGEAFNSLANSDLTPTADPGAVIDTATPPTVVAAASAPSEYKSQPEFKSQSPVNLGASSAGRAH